MSNKPVKPLDSSVSWLSLVQPAPPPFNEDDAMIDCGGEAIYRAAGEPEPLGAAVGKKVAELPRAEAKEGASRLIPFNGGGHG